MKQCILVLALSLVIVTATTSKVRGAEPLAGGTLVHTGRGVIREISPDRRKAVIRHEAIPNYMPAMTMEFVVRDPNELNGVVVGDAVTFSLTTAADTHWIDRIQRIAGTTNNPPSTPQSSPNRSRVRELRQGDLLPDYELLTEDGRQIRFSDFRGKALAFTFFFTRCPLPDYCPRMGNNFAKARELMLARTGVATNWQFLSISFDPDFDQPAVLASYANSYRAAKADRWLFVVAPIKALSDLAPRLDLIVHHDSEGGISHNLRTVVLDPQGRIYRQFDGNEWTPQELADALVEAPTLRR